MIFIKCSRIVGLQQLHLPKQLFELEHFLHISSRAAQSACRSGPAIAHSFGFLSVLTAHCSIRIL